MLRTFGTAFWIYHDWRRECAMEEESMKKISLKALLLTAVFCLMMCSAGTVKAAQVKAKGIDVSHWNETIDWAKVRADGIDFAMVGMGVVYPNGTTWLDPKFHYNMKNAIANGIQVGVYLYSKATTVEQARTEAKFVLKNIEGYKITYPVAIDIEDPLHEKLTNGERTLICLSFMEVIRSAGYHPMTYSSDYWYLYQMNLNAFSGYDLWVARWGGNGITSPTCIWQYTEKGRVNGISTDVDLNYSYVDYASIIPPRYYANSVVWTKGWHTNGGVTWYIKSDGSLAKGTFMTIGGKKYYFSKDGYMATGWQTINGNRYYFNDNGVRQTGWKTIDGKRYFFNSTSGVLKKGWMVKNGNKYYLDPSTGVMQKGRVQIGNFSYYFSNTSGVMRKGWVIVKTKKKYFANPGTGVLVKGWLSVNGSRYFINSDYTLAYGWKKIGGKWYYFHSKTGIMLKNTKMNG